MKRFVASLAIVCALGAGSRGDAAPAARNVLFICVDDLRPELNCYGKSQIVSPNIDRLAAGGFQFNRAYIQQAICSPSRTSLMTGLRPDSTLVYELVTHFRDTVPWVETMPQYFAKHGYHSAGIGKIYHGNLNDELSWSEPWVSGGGAHYAITSNGLNKAATENADVSDNTYKDGAVTEVAVAKLAELRTKQPFFYAVGYRKPHLPFTAPKTYWDLYDTPDLELPYTRQHAVDAASYAYTDWGELRSYYGIPANGPVSLDQEKELIHAYYACVSYVDKLIGDLLAALESEGLAGNTIVVLWGDHGWHLGNQNQWCKHTNFERATRIPMIIRVPWMSGGQQLGQLVESVDLYPTLTELCGLPQPSHLQGDSLVPLLENPTLPGDDHALSQYPRSGTMGYSMRTDRHRYTEWRVRNSSTVMARELYDYDLDPGEGTNVVDRAAYAVTASNLAVRMEARLGELSPATGGSAAQLLANNEFDHGLTNWAQTASGSAEVSFNVLPGDGGNGLGDDPLLHVAITNGTENTYRVAIEQTVPAQSNRLYTIRFRARAATNRSIKILWRNKNNAAGACLNLVVPIDAQSRLYEFSNLGLSMTNAADPDAEIRVQFGGDNADVWIDSLEVYALTSFATALRDAGLSGADALLYADADGDRTGNLFEYAFNMNMRAADRIPLAPGIGTNGVPHIAVVGDAGPRALEMEFMRRRGAYDLVYAPEFRGDLISGAWTTATNETVTPIDADWERVRVRDRETTVTAAARFGRVRVRIEP